MQKSSWSGSVIKFYHEELFAGGGTPGQVNRQLIYHTIASTGNAQDFGNLTTGKRKCCWCDESPTRGVFAGGYNSKFQLVNTNTIEYITIASTGNAEDFGDLTLEHRGDMGGCIKFYSWLFAGGGELQLSAINTIDYITIATTGNAT